MSQYIYGTFELAYAINESTQRQVSVRMAEDLIARSWQQAGWEGIKNTASNYGLNVTLDASGYPAWYSMAEVETLGSDLVPALYRPAMNTTLDTATNEVVVETASQVATESGSLISAGGVATLVKAINIVGAVATGVKLGWESYKDHPDFWTDLSNSIFDTDDPNTPIEVLAKAHAGGYTTYAREEEILKILQGLADEGCFDYYEYDSTMSDVEQSGVKPVTFTSVGVQGTACALAYDKVSDICPSGTLINICADHEEVDSLGRTVIVGSASVIEPANMPTELYMSKIPQSAGGSEYGWMATVPHCYTVWTTIIKETGAITYNITQDHSLNVYSGYYYAPSGRVFCGGININKRQVLATNEMFTNDHIVETVTLAPNSTALQAQEQLRRLFPDWYNNSYEVTTYDPTTGTNKKERWYPITIPWWNPFSEYTPPEYTPYVAPTGEVYEEPDPKSKPQGHEITDPEVQTDPKDIPYVPIVPPTPTPDSPILPYADTSDALWSVYNPVISELNDLGAYLWSSNIVDILMKFLQNPMDAIISLHKVYCTPDRGPRQNIVLGYLDSGVSSITVTNQYKTVDCGSVVVPEYFADARDYDTPYTIVELYLPFIGIVRLRTEDIIGGTVNVVYNIDLYSGACLARVYVTKLGAKQLLYNFSGNCSTQIPLTGADRTRLLSGAVAGATTGAVAGGWVGAIAGAVAGAWKGGTSIDRTGGYSANAGCMGVKTPYLLITRKYSYDAGSYSQFYGFPSNITVQLGTCKGYTRVKSVHITNMLRATDNEKKEIENLLKQGVIIN